LHLELRGLDWVLPYTAFIVAWHGSHAVYDIVTQRSNIVYELEPLHDLIEHHFFVLINRSRTADDLLGFDLLKEFVKSGV
jgi:hypothetical protein